MTDVAGWHTVVRLVLRRDRVRLPVWLLSIAGVVYVQAASIVGLYTDPAELAEAGRLMENNAAFIAMAGPPLALDTLGGRTAFEISLFAMVLAALMNLFLVTRHIRAEEESGRAELVRAGVVGRYAPAMAVLLVAVAVDVVLAVLTAAGLLAVGLPAAGSWALAVGIAGVGLVFAGIATVTSQLTASTRSASGLAGAALGVAFVVRAAGDVGTGTLSWFSPLGWGQALRPFARERWWPVALMVASALALLGVAFALGNRRDLGSGLVQASPGPAVAGESLLRPAGLALRLHRASLVAWGSGLLLMGIAYGSIGNDIESLIGDNEVMREVAAQVGDNLVDGFLASTSMILALIAAGFAAQGTLRLRVEEQAGRVEPLLAAALARRTWARSHLEVVAAGGLALLVLAGLGTGLAFGVATGDPGEVPRLVAASVVYAPALMVVVALTFALQNVVPAAATAVWGVLGFWLVSAMLGQVLRLPDWVLDLSPFQHVPKLPAVPVSWPPLVALTVAAAVLLAVGDVALRHRDVAT